MRRYGALLGAFACAMACCDAEGSFVRIRDAAGGETPLGSPGGFYLEGTASLARAHVNGSAEHLAVGVFDFEISTGGDIWVEFMSFCTEPTADIGFDEWPGDQQGFIYEAVPLTSGSFTAPEAVILETLWANAFPLAQSSRTAAGAFQAIIWELSQDDTIDLSDGDFSLIENLPDTQAMGDLAREWLDLIDEGTWTGGEKLVELVTPFSQNLLMPMRFVPSPGTAGVLMLGALVVGRRRR